MHVNGDSATPSNAAENVHIKKKKSTRISKLLLIPTDSAHKKKKGCKLAQCGLASYRATAHPRQKPEYMPYIPAADHVVKYLHIKNPTREHSLIKYYGSFVTQHCTSPKLESSNIKKGTLNRRKKHS